MSLASRAKFLSETDMQKIHEASLYLLENKGVIFKAPEAVELFKQHGARVDGELVYIPKSLVEECLKQVPSEFLVEAINPERSITIGGESLIIHPD